MSEPPSFYYLYIGSKVKLVYKIKSFDILNCTVSGWKTRAGDAESLAFFNNGNVYTVIESMKFVVKITKEEYEECLGIG